MKKHLPLIIIFTIALLLRLAFIPNPGFEADVAFWKGWGLAAADKGVVWGMLNTNNNYPTPFAYTLGTMVTFYRILGGNPHDFNEYWSNTNTRFLFASKLPAVTADFGIAILLLLIGNTFGHLFQPTNTIGEYTNERKKKTKKLFTFLAILYLLNPVVIMDGAWWGQVDSLGVIVFLVAFILTLYKKPFLAGFIFMFAMMTKLQNMIYGPLFFLYLWQLFGLRGLIQVIAGAATGFFGLNIEFFLSKNMQRVISSLVDNYDYFPYMSLHAYNIWWIVSKGDGMGVSDKLLTFGSMTAKSVGMALFVSSYLLACLQLTLPSLLPMIVGKNKLKKQTEFDEEESLKRNILHLFLGLSIINTAFFLFQTQSHERYAFPLTAFLLLLVPFITIKKRIYFYCGYILWSILYFYNLHTAFAVNYPDNVFQFLQGWFLTPTPTITVSIIFLFLFSLFILFFTKELTILALTITGASLLFLIVSSNFSYWQKKPIPLSTRTPWYSRQDYGQRVKDMPLAGGGNPKSWTWLSTQYAFFRKGIGTHANSEIRYDVGRRFSTFTTNYGIDTTAGNQASAIFEIWGDEKQLFVSPVMKRFDLPKYATVNIQGVKTLILITRDAGNGNNDDHTNWMNPKLYP